MLFFGLTVFCVCLLMLRNHKYRNKNVSYRKGRLKYSDGL